MTKFICWWSLSKFLSWKENVKKCTSFEEQKGMTVLYLGKRLFWHCFQLSFVYKIVSQISLNLLCLGDKRLLSEFLRKWAMRLILGQNECFPNKIFWLNIKISKNWDSFIDDRALITATLISFCHWIGKPLYVGIFLGALHFGPPPLLFWWLIKKKLG